MLCYFCPVGKKRGRERERGGERKQHFKPNLLSVTVNWCDLVLRGWSCECLQNTEREA